MRHVFAFALMAAAALVAGCTNGAGVTCPPGQTLCGEVCVYTQSDPQNCGSCGNVCQGDLVCIGGVCGCPKGQTACDGKCVDTKSDVNNCGACGTMCPMPQVCSMSMCSGGCAAGLTDCNRSCVDLNNDDNNCGACGTACLGDLDCVGGMCVHQCPSGQVACGDKCVSLMSDSANCGACGNVCPNEYFCIFGSCILGCPQPLTRCVPDGGASDGGSQCIDTRFDPNNCGGCGGGDASPSPSPFQANLYLPHICHATEGFNDSAVCNMGRCDWVCNEGTLDCEFQPLGCGIDCLGKAPPQSFGSGGLPVPAPVEEMCVDPSSDPCNCGGCNDDCLGNNDNFCFGKRGGEPSQACCTAVCTTINQAGACGNCAGQVDCSQTLLASSPLPSTLPYPLSSSPPFIPGCCPDVSLNGNHNCVDFANDVHNCGQGNCGNDCTMQGFAQPMCCYDNCRDLRGDTSCGNNCDQATDCTGFNVFPSPSTGACCNVTGSNSCVEINFDINNCGGCGNVCPTCPPGHFIQCQTGVCACPSNPA